MKIQKEFVIYLVFNGFDLFHKVESLYSDFRKYFSKEYPVEYQKFCELYGLYSIIDLGHGDVECNYEDDKKIKLWEDFEVLLSKIDQRFIDSKFADFSTAKDITKTEFADILDPCKSWVEKVFEKNINLYNLYEPLQNAFYKWTSELDKNLIATKRCNCLAPFFPIKKSENSCYINFNYTHTLEKVYDIDEDRVFHIHGETLNNNNPPLFGHTSRQLYDKLECEMFFSQESKVYKWFLEYINRTIKPVQKCCEKMENYLRKFNLEKYQKIVVNVIGSSFSEVDKEYFISIARLFPNADWNISYHTNDDYHKIIEIEYLDTVNKTLFKM